MDVAGGGAPPFLGFVGQRPLGVWAPAGLWPSRAQTPPDTFRKQITDEKVFCKQITDGEAGYGTIREPFHNYATPFSLE